MSSPCPFCSLDPSRISRATRHAFAIRDAFPISPGHTLIIPKRHVASFFETSDEERADLIALLLDARHDLDKEFAPAAYNIGINDGLAAGQTVMHLHVHLIPRYPGDSRDPRGGVRWVLPEHAAYWSRE